MTTRLYYAEPYRTSFSATVVSCDDYDGQFHVVLDQTAFYPTSGGQPFDIGNLGGAAVTEVIDGENGDIVHVVERSLPPGAVVDGAIDWKRRFDHMQQHTGQHVLSAAYDRLFGVRTESFHLGTASATIDLGREVTPSQVQAAEDEANRVVWEDRPVAIRVASAEEAAALPLRKESLRTGPVRLIEIEDFDLSACGGTHVARTGAIGVIATGRWEKFRGGMRIEFLCGGRALARFREWRDALQATLRHLSVQPLDLADAVGKLQSDARMLQKTIRSQQERLAVHDAAALVARGEHVGHLILVVDALDGWDAVGLKALAVAATAAAPAAVVAVFSRTSPAIAVVARGSAAEIDAGGVLKALIAKFGGKGGGKAELAQGGGLAGQADELIAEARRLLHLAIE
jgi:alanyl-tRNA synthetase